MSLLNKLLQTGYKSEIPEAKVLARQLEHDGLGEAKDEKYVKCTSTEDEDYEIAKESGCGGKVEIPSNEVDSVICKCGRILDLSGKKKYTKYWFDPDWNAIRDYVREIIKQRCDLTKGRQKNLNYFSYEFEKRVVDFDIEKFIDGEPVQTTVRVHFVFDSLSNATVDTIKLYGRKGVFILAGDGALSKKQFEQNDLPVLEFSQFYQNDDSTVEEQIWEVFHKARKTDALTDIARRASIAKKLYENHRGNSNTNDDVIDEDDFEHITNNLFNYCFKTSKIFGSVDSGKPVPDGILCLQANNRARAYIWDAKYSDPRKEPHDISSSNQRNMTKYPIKLKEVSNVGDGGDFKEFAGFILISPKISEDSLEGLAKKMNERYEENDEAGALAIIHLRIDALITLYELLKRNTSQAQKQINWVRIEFDNLLKNTDYHNNTPEYEDIPAEITMIDVSSDEVRGIFENNLNPDGSEFKELNYGDIRDRIGRFYD